MNDIIQGDKFKTVAKHIFAPMIKNRGDYDNLQNTLNLPDVCNGDIIYTHTMYAKQLFDTLPFSSGDLILVTHNSDVNIDDKLVYEMPNCITKWFTTNVNTKNEKVESIPIGLENDRWMMKVNKILIMKEVLKNPQVMRNLVYMNHNINTNTQARLKPYSVLNNKPFVTVEKGYNGQDFNKYIDNLYHHRFMICPEGNGMDTHRTWESLYMGVIPIEKRNANNRFYEDYPICFVDDWEEITESFLEKAFHRIQSMNWDLKKLEFNYWANKIKSSCQISVQ
jgi:hypothetical protein